MARNKNRKKTASNSQNAKKTASVSDKDLTLKKKSTVDKDIQKPTSSEKIKSTLENIPDGSESSARDSSPESGKSLVRLSTCIAGMFLTFILGLYLGSLLPGILRGMEEESHLTQRPLEIAPAPPLPPAQPAEARVEKALPEQNAAPREKGSIRDSIPKEILEHIRHLEKDAASHPSDAPLWTELGNAYFDIHEPQNAISAYEHSLSLAPENPDVLTDLGIMYREIKNYDKALECFRKAQQYDPRHINALFNEGVVLSADLDRNAEAARVWTRILDIDPTAATPNGEKIADMVRKLQ